MSHVQLIQYQVELSVIWNFLRQHYYHQQSIHDVLA